MTEIRALQYLLPALNVWPGGERGGRWAGQRSYFRGDVRPPYSLAGLHMVGRPEAVGRVARLG